MNKKLNKPIKLKVFAEENCILSEKIKACFAFYCFGFLWLFFLGVRTRQKAGNKIIFYYNADLFRLSFNSTKGSTKKSPEYSEDLGYDALQPTF